ncbi:LAMI_0E15720g1_1 [Lachancea mirantina]|uniref:LAMI_0E15720g1_1 n=1 Tax=Lachancea mirantina TaxID=1230905 RepID=A0A1G4JSJ4_9SACH|nr:LAMI_0E15720g1_1 [Lachancea mirantina]
MSIKAISSSNVILEGLQQPATIVYSTESGKILEIFDEVVPRLQDSRLASLNVSEYIIVSPHVIMPGLVDTHVHLNEPGRTEWEGFATGTQAAATGGVTTVVDMPLNAIPPTTTVENLEIKLSAAEGQLWCDVAFWGGLVPDNIESLVPLVQAGVRGFKGFLIDSGVDEFPMIEKRHIKAAFDVLEGHKTVLLFHAELQSSSHHHTVVNNDGLNLRSIRSLDGTETMTEEQSNALALSTVLSPAEPRRGEPSHIVHHDDQISAPLTEAAKEDDNLSNIDPKSYLSFLLSRPDAFETNAIGLIISCLKEMMQKKGSVTPVHIVHLASREAIPLVASAQRDFNLPITAETCFHYLTFAAERIERSATVMKCCPPIRDENNRLGLWEGLTDGIISTVVSDHSPCTPELKNLANGDFFAAWGGISSVGLGLPIIFTEAQKFSRSITLCDIVRWCCENTAIQVGLQDRKGFLKVGHDADFIIFDRYQEQKIRNENVQFRNKITAYHKLPLRGRVLTTVLRGRVIFEDDSGISSNPMGQTLLEPRKL